MSTERETEIHALDSSLGTGGCCCSSYKDPGVAQGSTFVASTLATYFVRHSVLKLDLKVAEEKSLELA